MIGTDDGEEPVIETPFLSHSRINRYLHCPEQYRLYYVEHLRLRVPAANLVFGQVVHKALAALFEKRSDPVAAFQASWTEAGQVDLDYGRESHEGLGIAGVQLLERFAREELPRISDVEAVERKFELQVTTLDLPLVGIIDLVAGLEDRRTVVDFKTATRGYEPHEVVLSDQLTAYRLAEPTATQAALCVFVKAREPRIEWHKADRTAADLTQYLRKAGIVGREIAARHFYKRPGKWCAWCDYLPLCAGDKEAANEKLIQVR
jgi:CRISPR/Cas system-associated exonuclease Cas4 (RecB family)